LWIPTNGLGVCSYRSIKIAFVSQQIALRCYFIFWATHHEFTFSGQNSRLSPFQFNLVDLAHYPTVPLIAAAIAEKRKLLEIICLNWRLDGAEIVPEMKKPFLSRQVGLTIFWTPDQ
jgi:hypothetical protein